MHVCQGLKEALIEVRLCSRVEELVLKKKSISPGDSLEIHSQKAGLCLTLLFISFWVLKLRCNPLHSLNCSSGNPLECSLGWQYAFLGYTGSTFQDQFSRLLENTNRSLIMRKFVVSRTCVAQNAVLLIFW